MDKIVRTSETDWLEKSINLYTEKQAFLLQDDAGLKLTRADLKSAVSLIRAAKSKGGVSRKQILGLLTGMGITGIGVWIIAAAIADPEPTTKLGLLITGGLVLTFTGSFGALTSLGVRFSVSARSPLGHSFEIKPE